jgi:uncharacterized protein YlxW (UPF0749 family)
VARTKETDIIAEIARLREQLRARNRDVAELRRHVSTYERAVRKVEAERDEALAKLEENPRPAEREAC